MCKGTPMNHLKCDRKTPPMNRVYSEMGKSFREKFAIFHIPFVEKKAKIPHRFREISQK